MEVWIGQNFWHIGTLQFKHLCASFSICIGIVKSSCCYFNYTVFTRVSTIINPDHILEFYLYTTYSDNNSFSLCTLY